MFKFRNIQLPVQLQRIGLGPEVDIEFELRPPPYGGANQFLIALKKQFEKSGVSVGLENVGRRTRGVLLNSFQYKTSRVKAIQRIGVPIVHRVDGPISVYRGRDLEVDQEIWKMNSEVAGTTIFQSQYSVTKHLELGLEFKNPVIIPNAVDASLFYPNTDWINPSGNGRKIRIVATSWSMNPKKGGKTYAWLDQVLDRSRYEFTFIGRIAEELPASKVIPPMTSTDLADELRKHDLFLTASENDCCSNAILEALACRLPVIYHDSGGSRELVGAGGLPYLDPLEIPNHLDKIASEIEAYRRNISYLSLADVSQRYLTHLLGMNRAHSE